MAHAYVELLDLRGRMQLGADDTADGVLRSIIEGVSAGIDQLLQTSFQPRQAARYFTARRSDYLRTRNLLSVASLRTDHDGDGQFERVWSASDYVLLPLNAADDGKPYTALQASPSGQARFPLTLRGVEIVGLWGYRLDLAAAGALAAPISASDTSFLLQGGHGVETLQTLLVDDEQMYVTEVAGDQVSVERGMGGTTAAAHENGAAVFRYRYPPQVTEAAVLQALRLYRRRDAPFGVTPGGELGESKTIPLTDPDAKRLLAGFGRPWTFGSM